MLIEGLAYYAYELQQDVIHLQNQCRPLAQQTKHLAAIKTALLQHLQAEQLTHFFAPHFTWRIHPHHEQLLIEDEYLLPPEYFKDIKLIPDLNKIKTALAQGHTLPGVTLKTTHSLNLIRR